MTILLITLKNKLSKWEEEFKMAEPPKHIKEKILMFFMRTSVPRILQEEVSEERVEDEINEHC